MRRAWIAVAVAAAAVAGAAWWASRPTRPPNFLVIDIDTLPDDRVGAMRDGEPVTPVIDALAARGARFTHAFSNSGWTLPAIASELTGRLPRPVETGRRARSWKAPGARTAPEILELYGWHTACFWGETLPGPMGEALAGTFDEVFVPKRPAPGADVIAWLERGPPEPFFALVHEIDLHNPYAMPVDDPAWPRVPAYNEAFRVLRAQVGDEAARAAVEARYDASLRAYDAALGRVLAALDEAGLADRTVVIVTSDHGEDFWEHVVVDHGVLYDTTLRVPLVVADPRADGGRVVDAPVQGVDLAPSLLELAGVPADVAMEGRSWAPLLRGEPPGEARPVLAVTDACHVALRTGDTKLILRGMRPGRPGQPPAGGGVRLRELLPDAEVPGCRDDLRVELYDLVGDPLERDDVALREPARAVALARELLAMLSPGAEAGREVQLTPEQEKAIRDQGYWGLVEPSAGQ
ncbi:MAG: sulfatase [Myxococcota bacterium]